MEILSLPIESWKEYRDLRKRALKEDPGAFSSSYGVAKDQPEEYWQGRLREALEGKKSWLLFARDGGRLCGMIGAFFREDSPERAIIVSVYVPKEERGRGVGARLMQRMLEILTATGRFHTARLGVNVTQEAALRLYIRYGFKEIGREPSTTGDGHTVEQIEMERPLGGEQD